jgi:hypothetical protein
MLNAVHAIYRAVRAGARGSRKRIVLVAFGTLPATHAAFGQAIGSPAADRARLNEIVQRGGSADSSAPLGLRVRPVLPDVRFVWNSAIPYSLNDGPLWAGRGANASVTSGVAAGYHSSSWTVEATLAPTLFYSQNLPFDIATEPAPGRSTYSSPWHLDATTGSADLPLRFGDRGLRGIDLGESEITVRVRAVEAGVSSAAEWWGPGVRNALVLSNNAAGIPRAFVRTARPIRTKVGEFGAELIAGTLTESVFFDTVAANNYRSLSGVKVTYRPPHANVELGLARTVYSPASGAVPSVGSALNALRWKATAGQADTLGYDQIASVFARWFFPGDGFEVYGEFARMQVPLSFSELLQTPDNTGGFTAGFQWAIPRDSAVTRFWRIQSEATALEQNVVYANHPPVDFYTGRTAAQGYTQRGQIIGAAIGPGSSSEFGALDYLTQLQQIGIFVGRIRWEDNALYRQTDATFFSHDVSIYSGVRGSHRWRNSDISLELTVARRFNYLFQNGSRNPGGQGTVRVQNITLATRISPR